MKRIFITLAICSLCILNEIKLETKSGKPSFRNFYSKNVTFMALFADARVNCISICIS